jgi:lipoate-protein ligase B
MYTDGAGGLIKYVMQNLKSNAQSLQNVVILLEQMVLVD